MSNVMFPYTRNAV